MTDEPLSDEDKRMIADLKGQARRNRARQLLAWALILVPGIPFVFVGIFTFGALVGGGGAVMAVVFWALLVQKLLPERSLTGND